IRWITTRSTLRHSAGASGTVLSAGPGSRWTLPRQRFSQGSEHEGIEMNRRQWLYGAGLIAGTGPLGFAIPAAPAKESPTGPKPLDLTRYEPKSMLQVHEGHVEKSKFPLIDFHTHISLSVKSE